MSNHAPVTHPEQTEAAAGPVGIADWLALAVLALAQFMLILDVTVINVALPQLSAEIGLSGSAAGWAIAAYAVPFGGLMVLGGRAADLFGSRRMFLTGLILFTAASLMAGLSVNGPTLLAARAVQGIGASLLSPAALATLTTRFMGRGRQQALAVWASIGGIGAAVGVLLGGLLTAGPGWRWIFYVNVPVGILVAIALPLLVAAQPAAAHGKRLDVLGGLVATIATGTLSFGIMNARPEAPMLAWLIPIVVALALFGVFAIVERRVAEPLIDLSVFARPPIRAGIFVMGLASALLIANFFLLSFVLQARLQWSPLTTGLAFLPVAVGTLIGAHLAGNMLSHLGGRAVAVASFAVAAAGYGFAALQFANPTLLIGAVAVAAFGLGGAFVTSTSTALSSVAHHEAGVISGLVNTFHEIGGALGVAIISAIAAASLASPLLEGGFTLALGISAAIALIGAGLAGLIVPPGKPAPGTPRFAH